MTVVFLGACGSDDNETSGTDIVIPELEDLPPGQQEAFENGAVDLREYSDAFARFQACSSDSGGSVEVVNRNAVSGLVTYSSRSEIGTPDQPELSTPEGSCYAEHFSWVELAFQSSDPAVLAEIERENQTILDEQIIPCLSKNGFDVDPDIVPGGDGFSEISRQWSDLLASGQC